MVYARKDEKASKRKICLYGEGLTAEPTCISTKAHC